VRYEARLARFNSNTAAKGKIVPSTFCYCVLVKGSFALAAGSILQRLDGQSEKKRE
jgi:hypothetical protein